MKKVLNVCAFAAISTLLSLAFVNVVHAWSSYTVGSLAITSTYNSYHGTYDYTDANAHATYSVSGVSVGSSGYAQFYTDLQRSYGGMWVGYGAKLTRLNTPNLSSRVVWNDIVAGSHRYHIYGNNGTAYVTMTVGSY